MKVNGLMIRLQDRGSTFIWMVQYTRESGVRISSMAMAKRVGLMELSIKGNISSDRSMARERSTGMISLHTLENSIITI